MVPLCIMHLCLVLWVYTAETWSCIEFQVLSFHHSDILVCVGCVLFLRGLFCIIQVEYLPVIAPLDNRKENASHFAERVSLCMVKLSGICHMLVHVKPF